ncbi:hypothetical protein [Agrobacterium radiobacter]|uniref:hypothetical protein n=1 Tax=Agrobacterium radiobacter TaxID=362 RepID=UPI0007610CA7|nr:MULTISPECIES: hypothetical protein [Agrobacterium tumefaciens complex]KAB0454730.1 hypothetical protein F7R04_26465 [Agrobacterium tumefaciens]KWT78392.1 hypothetical protein ASH09_26070 [Agrobacterium radiobacter]NIB13505.1 hypothetical protein [Agrobacterium radiobacter]OOO40393.1 hypothetical protein BS628_01025 [Agrobacterium radiobacter]
MKAANDSQVSKQVLIVPLRGALALYGPDQKEAARYLVALLASQEVLHQAREDVVNQHFDLTDWRISAV